MLKKNDLLEQLKIKGVEYTRYDHEALFSVQESKVKRGDIEGAHTKNLFLKNKKNYFCLLSCEEKSVIDLKKFSKVIGAGNLSFAKKKYLLKYMGINPGSVSPYGLLNDKNNEIVFFLESSLYKKQKINFHPLINTSTITTLTSDFIKFMIENKKKINIFSLEDYKIIQTI